MSSFMLLIAIMRLENVITKKALIGGAIFFIFGNKRKCAQVKWTHVGAERVDPLLLFLILPQNNHIEDLFSSKVGK